MTEGQSLQSTVRLDRLQQLVSTTTESLEAGQYKKYKESFVKQIRFDPEKPNLSNLNFTLERKFNTIFFQLL